MSNPNIYPGQTVIFGEGRRGEVLADDDPRIPPAHRLSPATRTPDSVYVLYDVPVDLGVGAYNLNQGFNADGSAYTFRTPAEQFVYGGWFRIDSLQLSVKVT